MFNGNVGGVGGGNDDGKWSKKLSEELDAADGKKDGKISANVWNGFMDKTGSKGNRIHNFIYLNNAEKSFDYYDRKKDVGNVDWKDWKNLLNVYLGKEEQQPPVDNNDEPPVNTQEREQQQKELDVALGESPIGELKKPEDYNNLDLSRYTLVADCGPNKDHRVDPNTNESITKEVSEDGKTVTVIYENDNTTHTVKFVDGKFSEGKIEKKQENGSIDVYTYTQDDDGKAVIQSKDTLTPVQGNDGPTEEQKAAFNALVESGVLTEVPKAAAQLKDAGYGVKKSEVMTEDENGMFYLQDMNGGRTYFNEAGESVRVSEFEGQLVPGGKLEVTHTSADGKTSNHIIYGEDDKPISGFVTVKDADGNVTATYNYEFDADGNRILKSCTTNGSGGAAPTNEPAKQEDLQAEVDKLPFNKEAIPNEQELIDAGYKKNETMMTSNGGVLFVNEQTGESVVLTPEPKSIQYKKGNVTIDQSYGADGKPTSGSISIKGENGAFATGVYEKDAEGKMAVALKQSHKAPAGSIEFANDGIAGHQASINKFREELGLPDNFRFELPPLTHSDNYHGEHVSDDGKYLTKVDVDKDGNVKISYSQKQNDGTFKEIGTMVLQKEESQGTLRGYDYKLTAHNNLNSNDTTISSASWDDFA